MTREIVIEDLRGRFMTAKVTDGGKHFSTYKDFAIKAGYPDAAVNIFDDEEELKSFKGRLKHTFKVLARGNHECPSYFDETIYVIESEDGERFLVGDGGLEITEPLTKLTPLQIHEMGYDELIKAHKLAEENADELSRALRRKAYANGYEQGRFDQRMESAYEDVAKIVRGSADEYVGKTPQQRRDEIVEQAKADVVELTSKAGGRQFREMPTTRGIGHVNVDFVVNKEKRTVVALLRYMYTDGIASKGIAKCDPSDCFNVHIGKAIALHRALGMDVPSEYINAPQPTEVRVGDVIVSDVYFPKTITGRAEKYYHYGYGKAFRTSDLPGWIGEEQCKITDDSRDEHSREEGV